MLIFLTPSRSISRHYDYYLLPRGGCLLLSFLQIHEKTTTWRSLAGFIALSTHTLLEGWAIGLGKQASDVWYLCGAVAAHKLAIAFSLGMEVRNASSFQSTVVTTCCRYHDQFYYPFHDHSSC